MPLHNGCVRCGMRAIVALHAWHKTGWKPDFRHRRAAKSEESPTNLSHRSVAAASLSFFFTITAGSANFISKYRCEFVAL